MTDKEKAIVMAYTGVSVLTGEKFSVFHKYIEDLLGRPVWTHEFADKSVWNEIKEKSKDDFIEICKTDDKPTGEWIPVSERLPDDLEPVNITWINHEPEPYYKKIKDKPFTATGVLFKGQWYWWSTLCTDMLAEYQHNHDDIIDEAIEIIAWQPLPEPYKEVSNDNP